MKSISKITVIIYSFLALCGCSDFLDIKDESAINPGIWDKETTAQIYINNIYASSMPGFGGDAIFSSTKASACSDETTSDNELILGELGTGSVGTYSAVSYQAIRNINIGLDEMKNSALTGTSRNNILGQLYFFRAYQHWKMILMHGGVPYMREVVDYNSSDSLTNAPRNKTSECIEFIKKDLQEAINYLPAKWENPDKDYGRITRAGAAGMLGRILLFYASPQFTADQNSAEAKARWQDAYDANDNAKKICLEDGYGLMDCTTPQTTQWPAASDINKIFTTTGGVNNEVLIVRVYNNSESGSHTYEGSVRPGEMTGSNSEPSNCPSLMLAWAFPNADGTVYEGSYTDKYYWKDRDPRFYSTIVYNGAYYKSKSNSSHRQWTYNGGDASPKPTTTGFYCRKMINDATEDYQRTSTFWVELRYAEVLLNLAEAALMTGKEDIMYDCLGQLRKRAGIPEGDKYYGLKANLDKYTLLELVMRERQIELAFESKRFYDLRRRNMFTSALGPNTPALNGQRKANWTATFSLKGISSGEFESKRDNMSMEEASEYMEMKNPTFARAKRIAYKCIEDPEQLKNETGGNYNFFDIQGGILSRSPAIKQNWGWTEGAFNPFE